MRKLLLVFILIPFVSFGQDNITKCDDERSYVTAKYVGCFDVEDNRDGYGVMTFNNGQTYEGFYKKDKRDGYGKLTLKDGTVYDGNWVNNKRDGYGKLTYEDGSFYDGNWANNMKNGVGKSLSKNDGQITSQEGDFKNDRFFNGDRKTTFDDESSIKSVFKNGDVTKKIQISTEYIIETIGSHFSNGTLETGTRKDISQNGNKIVEKKFKDGDEIIGSEKSNIKNYYEEDDIDGDQDKVEINLDTEPNSNSKYINLEFATETPLGSFRFIFDTGAEVMSIGYNLFEKLKENGLEYEDMNVRVQTIGTLGVPINNKVVKLKEITIGQYKVKNVIAVVKTQRTANFSLLGIGFMKKFKNVFWSLNDDKVIFYK